MDHLPLRVFFYITIQMLPTFFAATEYVWIYGATPHKALFVGIDLHLMKPPQIHEDVCA